MRSGIDSSAVRRRSACSIRRSDSIFARRAREARSRGSLGALRSRAVIQLQETIEVRTRGRGLHDLTRELRDIVERSRVHTGLAVAFCAHTSASLAIQENADPSVQHDLLDWLARIAPDGDPRFRHDAEGPDDMPAHVRSAITRTSESIPVVGGKLALGTWQALYLIEHRTSAHSRRVVVHVTGEEASTRSSPS
jgi:secondary thiamine-phosphate synthase enzyme